MPGPKYTKIEITPEAYLALEAETILQSKTLKGLASELILNGVSQESLDFAQRAISSKAVGSNLNGDKIAKVIKDIGKTNVRVDEAFLEIIQKKLLEEGYMATMLHVALHTASVQRDELHRALTICEYHKLPPAVSAEVIKNLNIVESGNAD
jgi:hypothetical protein